MSAKIFCMASAKGGSGKTSITATLGTFLASLHKKTLLIDADFATTGLTLFYIKEIKIGAELEHSRRRQPNGLMEYLLSDNSYSGVAISECLDLIPATFGLLKHSYSVDESTHGKFKSLLRHLSDSYEYIIIDAQAGADDLACVAMNRDISHEVIIVSEYDPMSAAGVERLKAILREDLTYDRTWVVLNKMLPEFARSFGDFLEVARYLSPIPWNAEVVRAYTRRRLAIDTDAGNEHTLAILNMVKGLLGDEIDRDLSEWMQSRAAAIKQPLEEQYMDAEQELSVLLRQLELINIKHRFSQRRMSMLFGGGLLALVLTFFLSDFLSNRSLSPWTLVTTGSIFGIVTGFVFWGMRTSTRGTAVSVEETLQRERYERQIELLKDRLKNLELLRTLEPEALIRRRSLRDHSSWLPT